MDRDIVIIGAAGQLGQDLSQRLGSRAAGLTHREIELRDRDSLARVLLPLRPRVVINTAAFTVLESRRWNELGLPPPQTWPDALREFLDVV